MLALFTSFSITFLVNLWFERGHIARSGLVVPLALSGLPVDFAILFGPGLIPITLTIFFDYVALLPIINRANTMPLGRRVSYFITCATSLETALLMKSFMVVPAAVAA